MSTNESTTDTETETETETETAITGTTATDYLDLTLPQPGYDAGLDPSWPELIVQAFDQIDAKVEVRDAEANLSDYAPKTGAKFLATDTGARYIGDGESWNALPAPGDSSGLENPLTGNLDAGGNDVQNVGSLEADELNNAPYASKFAGATLADRIQAGIDAGASTIRVSRKDGAYDWFTNVQTPVDFDLMFEDYWQDINFEGSSASGDADVALEPSRRLCLRGGRWQTSRTDSWDTSDPWTWMQPPGAMSDSDIQAAEAAYFEKGINLFATDDVAWNTFKLRRLVNCHEGIIVDNDGSSNAYANENRFYISHIIQQGTHPDGTEIDFNNKHGNQNSLVESDLAAQTGTMIRIDQGGQLRLHNCRMEANDTGSTFIETTGNGGSRPGVVITGWNKALDAVRAEGKLDLNDPEDVVVTGDGVWAVAGGRGRQFNVPNGAQRTDREINANATARTEAKSTTGVAQTATDIFDGAANGGLSKIRVWGHEQGNQSNRFLDEVVYSYQTVESTTILADKTGATRNYTANNSLLQLDMSEGTHDVNAVGTRYEQP